MKLFFKDSFLTFQVISKRLYFGIIPLEFYPFKNIAWLAWNIEIRRVDNEQKMFENLVDNICQYRAIKLENQ